MTSVKQKKAFNNMVDNGGNISKAMVDAGYSPATANTPQKLTESKGWKELMETYLPDDFLAKKHKELLDKVDDKGLIDTNAVKGGLDMAYKLKGAYAPDKNINININQEMTPEALERAKAFDEWYKKQQTSKT